MPVHDVDVDDMSPTLARGSHLFAQPGEVRGKN
jgi:hypothetical protein